MPISDAKKLTLAFAAVYLIWGSTYLAIKYAVETIPPFMMMAVRSTLAGLVLLAWAALKHGERIQREHVPALLVIGASFFLIGHGLLAWAQQRVPSGIAALLVASLPLWIVLIERFVMGELLGGYKTVLGLIVGFVGMLILVAPWESARVQQLDVVGVGAILLGSFSWAAGSVYSRTAKLPRSPVLAAAWELIFGGLLLFAVGIALGEGSTFSMNDVSPRSLVALAYLVVFGSVVAFTAYLWLLTATTATRVSTYAYVNPVVAMFLGWALAGEPFTAATLLATGAIVVSVYLVLTARSMKTFAQENTAPRPAR
jgi:drug/metabolite transporter (DMT)-like permease